MSRAYTTDRGLVPRTREAIKYAYPATTLYMRHVRRTGATQQQHERGTHKHSSLSCRPALTNGSPRSLHSRARQTILLAKAAHSCPTTAHQTTKICRVPPLTRNDASRASATLLARGTLTRIGQLCSRRGRASVGAKPKTKAGR